MPKPTMAGAITASYDEVNGGIDVNVQSSTLPVFQYFLMNEIKRDITLTAPIAVDAEVINVSVGHGFVGQAIAPGETIVVRSGDIFLQMLTTTVSTNAIGIEMPVAIALPDTAHVMRGNILLNVNGSSTPVDFEFTTDRDGGVDAVVPIDLSTLVITMQHASAATDSLFGGGAVLTKGFYFRKVNNFNTNFGNYRDNQKFRDLGALVGYTDKAGGSNHGTNIVFDIPKVFKQEVRLNPRVADKVLGRVRDNIVLVKFTVSLIGSLTSGE